MNGFMSIVNLVIAIAFGVLAGTTVKDFAVEDYKNIEDGENILKGALMIIVCVIFLIIAVIGGCTACCSYCCIGSVCLSIFSLVFGIILFAVGAVLYLKEDDLLEMAC
jgi:hypothetical protein